MSFRLGRKRAVMYGGLNVWIWVSLVLPWFFFGSPYLSSGLRLDALDLDYLVLGLFELELVLIRLSLDLARLVAIPRCLFRGLLLEV